MKAADRPAENVPPESRHGPGRPRDPHLEARRRAQILDVAARIFAAHGFANTTVQTIANHIGVGNGTIYRYFPTKEQLFLAAIERGLEELSARMDEVLQQSGDPLDILRQAIFTYFQFFHQRPEMAELFIQERAAFQHHHRPLYFATHRDDAKFQKHQQFYERLRATGRIRPIPFEQLFALVGDLLYGAILTNLLTNRSIDPKTQAEQVADFILHGILMAHTHPPGQAVEPAPTLAGPAVTDK